VHEAWRLTYGMVMPEAREQYPKAEFAGCVMAEEQRIYLATGKLEWERRTGRVRIPSAATGGGSGTRVLDLADLVDTSQGWEVDQGP
jgi:hypothetical protein